jgi:hypothetical protein
VILEIVDGRALEIAGRGLGLVQSHDELVVFPEHGMVLRALLFGGTRRKFLGAVRTIGQWTCQQSTTCAELGRCGKLCIFIRPDDDDDPGDCLLSSSRSWTTQMMCGDFARERDK